jgi:ketosteroid isomerase-like protein
MDLSHRLPSHNIIERIDTVDLRTLIQPLPGGARRLLFALAIVLAAASTPASATSAGHPTAARNEGIVRQAFEGWAAGTSSFAELLAPDVAWTIHGSGPVAGLYRGREDFVERATRPLISRLATPLVPNVHHIWAAGDSVIIRFDAAATTNSGSIYRNQFVWIFRIRDGLVVEAEAFLDLVAYQDVLDNNQPRNR